MQVWSFASGSDGNCYLVESEGTALLVECGRPYAQIRDFLEGVGMAPEGLAGIVLTHAHGDHSRSARYLSVTHRVPIYASRGTLGALSLDDPSLARPIESGKTYAVGQMDVKPFAVPHDCHEPLGFRFEAGTYGHLSNAAAAEAIVACGERGPRAVWLAHLSERNNSQKHALQTVSRILRRHGLGHVPLETTHHRRSNLRWSSDIARERQLPLFR